MVTAGAAATTVLGSSLFQLESVWAAPYIRRNLGGMTASDPVLVSYRKAIKAMKMLPDSNPLSWAYQAAIHGVPGPATHTAGTPVNMARHTSGHGIACIFTGLSASSGKCLVTMDGLCL